MMGFVRSLTTSQTGANVMLIPRRRASTAVRMSFTPDTTAESASKRHPGEDPSSRANVVFPVPGGPQRIIEGMSSLAIRPRSALSSPSR